MQDIPDSQVAGPPSVPPSTAPSDCPLLIARTVSPAASCRGTYLRGVEQPAQQAATTVHRITLVIDLMGPPSDPPPGALRAPHWLGWNSKRPRIANPEDRTPNPKRKQAGFPFSTTPLLSPHPIVPRPGSAGSRLSDHRLDPRPGRYRLVAMDGPVNTPARSAWLVGAGRTRWARARDRLRWLTDDGEERTRGEKATSALQEQPGRGGTPHAHGRRRSATRDIVGRVTDAEDQGCCEEAQERRQRRNRGGATHITGRLGHVTAGDMQRLLVVKPDERVLAAGDRIAAPLSAAIFNNELESIALARTRDELLPRLLSGNLRVTHAERTASEVA